MRGIELGTEVVERNDWPLPSPRAVHTRLCKHASDRAEFFLPPGKMFLTRSLLERQGPVCAMRASRRMSQCAVSRALCSQHLRERHTALPPNAKFQARSTELGQIRL